ncbi:MAG TPA: porphobilinogen synthase [Firmicutes bacterium]|jgi:porphobilinogen synthase|nr:porphobilinogen synthase [Bacillota bacterium]
MLYRMRRLRVDETMRSLVRETVLNVKDLVYPIFVVEGNQVKKPVSAMPGVSNLSLDMYLRELEEIAELGIPAVLLFGVPDVKDEVGSGAYDPNGIVQRALREGKKRFPELLFIADVCLCEYTSHGHCGLVHEGMVLNDETLPLLAKSAVSYAEAGASIIAPSDMMDGRVGAIRKALDEQGFSHIAIMSYSAKYASAFYGPFREAAQSKPAFGDRKSYQMDYSNRREAIREAELDITEGADIIMVKPALAYLDVIREFAIRFDIPLAAYQVSGEYAMIKAAAQQGWIDEKAVALESVTAIKRAGAKIIITYFAKQVAAWLKSSG